MELDRSFGFLLVMFTGFFSLSQAFNFYVGGKDGWVLHPSENYNHWAERNRFQVNDSLIFKYKKGSDSVLLVNKDDYSKCNRDNPILKMENGESVFKFDRSGPFFFISGNSNGSCEKGQRLIVIVLAVRPPKGTTPVLPPSHAPSTSPTLPPSAVAKPPVIPPAYTPAMTPLSPSPIYTPSHAPATTPTSSPSPAYAPSISLSPSPATSPTPKTSPANSPSPLASTPSISPGPAESTPASPSPSESDNSPSADVEAPAPSPSAAWRAAVNPSALLVTAVTMVLAFTFGSSVNAF